MKLTLKHVADHVHDETDAYRLLEELRWRGAPVCSHCGHDKAYFLRPRNGSSRGTGKRNAEGKRTMTVRRTWKCAKCRKQFSVLTGTVLHGSKIPIQTWLTVMVQTSAAENGISGRGIERLHGLTPETAWYMLHRLREAMKREPMAGLLSEPLWPTRRSALASQGTTKHHPTPEEWDDRVMVPAPAEVAIRAFLAVDPATPPVEPPRL